MLTVAERLWDKVAVAGLDECWPWTGATTSKGYGHFMTGKRYGFSQYPHRMVCLITHGKLADHEMVLHSCDHKRCCNPCHLRKGTHQDNMDDKVKRRRQAKGPGSTTPVGENHVRAKLTETEVIMIIQSSLTIKELSMSYGVSRCCISNIRSRKSWRHLNV